MRSSAGKISADKLIKSLSSCEKYAALTLTDAYTYLYDCACKFVKNTWSSLYSFVRYFKDLMEHGEAGSEPDTKNRDAVTVMSIHQSKGLEFNVCILFGFGKRFNMSNRFPIIFNKECGASMKLPPILDEGTDAISKISMRYENNPIFKTVDRYNQSKQLEEEARIFYVALTRARERLYISATLPKTLEEYLVKYRSCADVCYDVKKSKTYINWILLSLVGADDAIYTINVFDKGAQHLTVPFARESVRSQQREISDQDLDLIKLIEENTARGEGELILSTVPAKVAASKVSSRMLDDSIFNPVPYGKLFTEKDEDADFASSDSARAVKKRIELMRSSPISFDDLLATNKKPTAAEIGTAAHAFLQFCDYDNVISCGIDNEIERLKNEHFITERTADIINKKQKKQLDAFFKSELFSRISSSSKLWREFKFGMFRNAEEFTENEERRKLVANKRIYVQGSIDLVIKDSDGGIILCDYKTDRVTSEERADRNLLIKNVKEKHGDQLTQYSYAIEQIFGQAPKSIYIYLLSTGESIEIN
jgi:ATP-dependent helicase/nuclease subunit A